MYILETLLLLILLYSSEPLSIEEAVESAETCLKDSQYPDVQKLEGYLALTDGILSTIKGNAFIRCTIDASPASDVDTVGWY